MQRLSEPGPTAANRTARSYPRRPVCWCVALLCAGCAAQPLAARETIGGFRGWAAFRDARPARCYAIAAPVRAGHPTGQAFASVALWPGRGLGETLHIRLSQPHAPAATVTISIGERRFVVAATRTDAWATDFASDRAMVAAVRSGRSMSVETVAADGRPFADTYALAGAATAIDAAALACRRR